MNTIAAVAAKAGFSISTVSRALRDDPRISAKTILLVKRVAAELGYCPNPYISILMSHLRTGKPAPFRSTIAFLDLFKDPETWKKWAVHRDWFAGAKRRAAELGYSVERFWAREPLMDEERMTKILLTRGITGVLIPPDDSHEIYLTPSIPIKIESFSVVTIGAQFHEPDLHFCSNDQFSSMRIACLQLLSLGYQRIGLVAPKYIEKIVDFRFGGAFMASQMLESGIREVLPICCKQERSEFEAWFRANKPDCILSLGHRSEVYDWIREMRIPVPEKLGFATLDCGSSNPEFSGINQNHEDVGAAALEFLVEKITRNERGAPRKAMGILIEGSWQFGKTTRRVGRSTDRSTGKSRRLSRAK